MKIRIVALIGCLAAVALVFVGTAEAATYRPHCQADVKTRAFQVGQDVAMKDGHLGSYRKDSTSFIPCLQRAFNRGLAYQFALTHEVGMLGRNSWIQFPAYFREAYNTGVALRRALVT